MTDKPDEKISEPMSHNKHVAVQAAFAAPGILMDLKDMFSSPDAAPGISSVIMTEVASAVGETVMDLAVPFVKILSIGWKIRSALKQAKKDAIAEIYAAFKQLGERVCLELSQQDDLNEGDTQEILLHLGASFDDTSIDPTLSPEEQRTKLLNLIAYLQGTSLSEKLSSAIGTAKAKDQQIGQTLETLEQAEGKNDVLCKILEEVGIPPEKEMAMIVETFHDLAADTQEPAQKEVESIPAEFMKGEVTAVKIGAVAGSKQDKSTTVGEQMTMEFPGTIACAVGGTIPFEQGAIRPTKITRLSTNSYRVETKRSVYIFSKAPSGETAEPVTQNVATSTEAVIENTASTANLVNNTLSLKENPAETALATFLRTALESSNSSLATPWSSPLNVQNQSWTVLNGELSPELGLRITFKNVVVDSTGALPSILGNTGSIFIWSSLGNRAPVGDSSDRTLITITNGSEISFTCRGESCGHQPGDEWLGYITRCIADGTESLRRLESAKRDSVPDYPTDSIGLWNMSTKIGELAWSLDKVAPATMEGQRTSAIIMAVHGPLSEKMDRSLEYISSELPVSQDIYRHDMEMLEAHFHAALKPLTVAAFDTMSELIRTNVQTPDAAMARWNEFKEKDSQSLEWLDAEASFINNMDVSQMQLSPTDYVSFMKGKKRVVCERAASLVRWQMRKRLKEMEKDLQTRAQAKE